MINSNNNKAINSKCTAIIVTYNSNGTIRATLDSLQEANKKNLLNIIVIDNASKDKTVDTVTNHYPHVALICNETNIGFGRACTIGLKQVNTSFALLLNPDAAISFKSIQSLILFHENEEKAGICGPAVIEPSGALQPSGNLPNPLTISLKPLIPGWATKNLRHVTPGEAPQKTDWICGSIMLLRMSMIKEIGFFDTNFFLYFEETDLCRRARDAGWEIWTVGTSVAEHINAASTSATGKRMIGGTIAEHYYKSRFFYLKKHFGLLSALITEVGEFICLALRHIIDILKGKPSDQLQSRLKSPFFQLPTFPTDSNSN